MTSSIHCLLLEDDHAVREVVSKLIARPQATGMQPTTLLNPAHLEELLDDLHKADSDHLKQTNFFVITDGSMKITEKADDTYKQGPQGRFSGVVNTCKGTVEVLNRWKDKIGNFFVTVLTARPGEHGLDSISSDTLSEGIKEYKLNPIDLDKSPCLIKPTSLKNIGIIWKHFLSLINPSGT